MLHIINSSESVFLIVQILSVLFLTILFLQSGIDKVVDKKGNLEWLSSHFSNSLFKNSVPLLLFTVTVVELFSGILPPLSYQSWSNYFELYKQIPQYKFINSIMSLDVFKVILYWEYFHRVI